MSDEVIYAIRRIDGEPMGDYSFMVTTGPNDWEYAEIEAEVDAIEPESIEFEIVKMTVERANVCKLPTNPHEQSGDDCDYCGEPWPCEWMQERGDPSDG